MKLVALQCPECNHSLAPENDHIVVACERCYAAVHIGDAGPTRLPVHFAAPKSEAQPTHWLPFWVFHGTVHIEKRATQDKGSGGAQAQLLWGEPRRLYVPAWELSLSKVQQVGGTMIQAQPAYQIGFQPAQLRLTPVTLPTQDAIKMLEFIVLAIEARRSDWLKRLDFQLNVGEPELWALPADNSGVVAMES